MIKLERSLADAIAKLERDRLKFQANDIKQELESNENNPKNNSFVIAENKVNQFHSQLLSHLLF